MTTRRGAGTFGWEYEEQRGESREVGADGFIPIPPLDPEQLVTEVTLRFEGTDLKGYTDVYEVERKAAPREVYLDACVGAELTSCVQWTYVENTNVVPVPAGGQPGDVLVWINFLHNEATSFSVPGGWDIEYGSSTGPFNGERLGVFCWSKEWDGDSGFITLGQSMRHSMMGLVRGTRYGPANVAAAGRNGGTSGGVFIETNPTAIVTGFDAVLISAWSAVSPVEGLKNPNTFLDQVPGPEFTDPAFLLCGSWPGGDWESPIATFTTAQQQLYGGVRVVVHGWSFP